MNRSERLNQELIFLSYRQTFHVKELMQEFNISKRTALRDISSLEQLGLSFYVEPGRYGGYQLMQQQLWVPILLNSQEINALFFALKALSLLSATPFEKSYQTIYKKLMATLSLSNQRQVAKLQRVVNYYSIPNLDAPTHLSDLLTAILDETVVQLTTSLVTAKFQIFDLLYRHGIWFFSGYDLDSNVWGIYRCDTIKSFQVSEQPAQYTWEQLAERQHAYDRDHHNIRYKCVLTPLGREHVQKNNYPNMRLEYQDGQDYLVGGYNQDELAYMIDYLLGLGRNVKIIYPEALKTGYLKELQQIQAFY